MNKMTIPKVHKGKDIFIKAVETYYNFFGVLPDLTKPEDMVEVCSICSDLKYVQENIRERQERKRSR